MRAKERAVLEKRDAEVRREDFEEAVNSYIDPLDPNLLAMQELAAVLACSDRRYLPSAWKDKDRGLLLEDFNRLKLHLRRGL
jgi:hypothetical protein